MAYPNITKPTKIYSSKYNQEKPAPKKLKPKMNMQEKETTTLLMGAPGPGGKPGSKIYIENGRPNDSIGKDSDLYLDKNTHNYYQKFQNKWEFQGNLTGKSGESGSNILFGNDTPSDLLGKKYDIYINRTNGFCYYKIDNKWIYQLKLTGDPGEPGSKGEPGERGSKIFSDDKFPIDSIVKDNDLFIDTKNNNYYLRQNNMWVLKGTFGGDTKPCNDKLTYTIFSTTLNAITSIPVFSSIAYFTWYYTNYDTYTDAIIIFSSIIYDRELIIQIVDINNKIIMAPYTITKNGIYTIPFQMPKYDTVLSIQISKNKEDGNNPFIYAANIEINKSTDTNI